MSNETEIRPFRVDVPDEAIADLQRRIAAMRLPSRELVADRSHGVQLATIQELSRFWATEYDWYGCEAFPRFNSSAAGPSRPRPHRTADGRHRKLRMARHLAAKPGGRSIKGHFSEISAACPRVSRPTIDQVGLGQAASWWSMLLLPRVTRTVPTSRSGVGPPRS